MSDDERRQEEERLIQGQTYLRLDQVEAVERLCRTAGRSKAEVYREAVDAFLASAAEALAARAARP